MKRLNDKLETQTVSNRKLEKENKEFTLKDFFKKFNEAGNIPISLVRSEILEESLDMIK